MHIWIVQHQLLRDKGVSPLVVVALFVQSPSPNSNYVALPSCVVVAAAVLLKSRRRRDYSAITLLFELCRMQSGNFILGYVVGVSLHMLIITTGEIFMQLQRRLDLVILKPSNFASSLI